MFRQDRPRILAAVTALAFAIGTLAAPRPAAAQWHGPSEPLPGTMSGKTILLIGAVTAFTVGSLLWATHASHKSNAKKTAEPDSLASSRGRTSLLLPPTSNEPGVAASLSAAPPSDLRPRLPLDLGFEPAAKQVLVRFSASF